MFSFQARYGDRWETVHPDFYGMHADPCADPINCEGCYDPQDDQGDEWLRAMVDDLDADAARVLVGSQVINERTQAPGA